MYINKSAKQIFIKMILRANALLCIYTTLKNSNLLALLINYY